MDVGESVRTREGRCVCVGGGCLMFKEIAWVPSIKQEREALGQKAGMEQRRRPTPVFLKEAAPRGLILKDRSFPPL